jgi:hypothetical protein
MSQSVLPSDEFVMPPCPGSLSRCTLTREQVLDPRVGIGLPLFMRSVRAYVIQIEPRAKTAAELAEIRDFTAHVNRCIAIVSCGHCRSGQFFAAALADLIELRRAYWFIIKHPSVLYISLRRAVNKALQWHLEPPTE